MGGSLVLGFFDGVHIAHRAVINSALKFADGKNTTLITFKDSPAIYFGKEKEYILTRSESITRIKTLGVTDVVELDFPAIAATTADKYLEYITKEFSPEAIFTGFNHSFGANKEGCSKFLEKNQRKYNYKYFCIPAQVVDKEIVSSTLIKDYLRNADVKKANSLLSENFIIEGTVIKGAQIGRKIGFPTANIQYPDGIVKIPFGVYKVIFENKPAILNWGMRPTVHNIKEPVAEIHIPNFEADLYDKKIRVEIIKQIRTEKQFNNLEELKIQISKDIKECLE